MWLSVLANLGFEPLGRELPSSTTWALTLPLILSALFLASYAFLFKRTAGEFKFPPSSLLRLFVVEKGSAVPVVPESGKRTHATRTLDDATTVETDSLNTSCPSGSEGGDGVIRVSKILIHPIKSCRGTSVQSSAYTAEGVVNDRKFAIVDASSHRVITAREKHHMVLISPRIVPGNSTGGIGKGCTSAVMVVSFPPESGCAEFQVPLHPDEQVLSQWEMVDDITLWGDTVDGYIVKSLSPPDSDVLTPETPSKTLSKYLGRDVHLVYKGPRPRPCQPTFSFPNLKATAVYQDGYPLLIASEESLEDLRGKIRDYAVGSGVAEVEKKWGRGEVEMERFRPNIVVRGTGKPWSEDTWDTIEILSSAPELESHPRSGPGVISLVSKCTRCMLPNIDTRTGTQDRTVPLKVLTASGYRTGIDPLNPSKACFGCNGVPRTDGVVCVGDVVNVLKTFS